MATTKYKRGEILLKLTATLLVLSFILTPLAPIFAQETMPIPGVTQNQINSNPDIPAPGQNIPNTTNTTAANSASTTKDVTTTTVYPSKNYNEDSNGKIEKHIFGNGIEVGTVTGTGTEPVPRYTHTDQLTGSNIVTNSLGTIDETLDYFPFGSIRIDSGSYSDQRKYIGQEYDTDIGLNYLNARYYNSGNGQFVSQDPVFWEIGQSQDGKKVLSNPQTMNSYSYAGNNPMANKDPSGRCLEDGCVIEASAIGGGAGFLGGLGFQYFSDVNSNIQQNGLKPSDFFKNLSSLNQYAANAGKGAVIGASGAAASAYELGALIVGGVTGTATAVTGYLGDRLMSQKTDIGPLVKDTLFNSVTGGAFEYLPGASGRLPHLFSTAFFTGAHTLNALAQEFVGGSAQLLFQSASSLGGGFQLTPPKNDTQTILSGPSNTSAQTKPATTRTKK